MGLWSSYYLFRLRQEGGFLDMAFQTILPRLLLLVNTSGLSWTNNFQAIATTNPTLLEVQIPATTCNNNTSFILWNGCCVHSCFVQVEVYEAVSSLEAIAGCFLHRTTHRQRAPQCTTNTIPWCARTPSTIYYLLGLVCDDEVFRDITKNPLLL